MDAIIEKIRSLIAEECKIPPEKIVENAEFSFDLGMDSLEQVEVLMRIERTFKISIPEQDADTIETLGQLAKFVADKLNQS